jgi:hypothetical protein
MADADLPQLPDRALTSRGVLYRPLQDIEVYVEDEDSEVFYTELLLRLIGTEVQINRVFALRGRERVLEECRKFHGTHRAIFIIDGDLDWVAGKPIPLIQKLFVHQCYCVENYLFSETAMLEVIVESSGRLSREEARRRLDWPKVRKEYQDPLIELFIEFAAAHLMKPDLPTISTGVGILCTQKTRKSAPDLDRSKVSLLCARVRDAVIQEVGPDDYQRTREKIALRVAEMADPFDAISGKSYLIPLQMFILKRFSRQNIDRPSFVFRLAKYCSLDRLDLLKNAIVNEANNGIRQEPDSVSASGPVPGASCEARHS